MNNVEIRLIDLNKDYETLCSWWSKRDHVIIPKEMLGSFGMIANVGNKDVAAAWIMPLLTTNTAMLRFPISDLEAKEEDRNIGIESVILSLHDFARDLNCKYVLCSTNHMGLIKRLKNLNYIEDSKDCVHLMGVL